MANPRLARLRAARAERRGRRCDVQLLSALPQFLQRRPLDASAGADRRLTGRIVALRRSNAHLDALCGVYESADPTVIAAVREALLALPDVAAAIEHEARAECLIEDGEISEGLGARQQALELYLRLYEDLWRTRDENKEFCCALQRERDAAQAAAEQLEQERIPELRRRLESVRCTARPQERGRRLWPSRGHRGPHTSTRTQLLTLGSDSRLRTAQQEAGALRDRVRALEETRRDFDAAYSMEIRARFMALFGSKEQQEDARRTAEERYVRIERLLRAYGRRLHLYLPPILLRLERWRSAAAPVQEQQRLQCLHRLQQLSADLAEGRFARIYEALGIEHDQTMPPPAREQRRLCERIAELAIRAGVSPAAAKSRVHAVLAAAHAAAHYRRLLGLRPGAAVEERRAAERYFREHCRIKLPDHAPLNDLQLLTAEDAGFLGFTLPHLGGGHAGGLSGRFGQEDLPAYMLIIDPAADMRRGWDHHLSHVALQIEWSACAPELSLERHVIDEICAVLAEGTSGSEPQPDWHDADVELLIKRLSQLAAAQCAHYAPILERRGASAGSPAARLSAELRTVSAELRLERGTCRWSRLERLLPAAQRFIALSSGAGRLAVRSLLIETGSLQQSALRLEGALRTLDGALIAA